MHELKLSNAPSGSVSLSADLISVAGLDMRRGELSRTTPLQAKGGNFNSCVLY
jgi:hypothetical protein